MQTNNHFIVLDMTQNTSDQSLLCCRACLTTDGKLSSIHEDKLADAFSRVSGTSVNNPLFKDMLPQHLCSYCRALLLKCASFRDMCDRTQQLLMTELLKGKLNTDNIRRINHPSCRFLNLTVTDVEMIDYTPSDEYTNDILHVEQPIEDIKDEPGIDIVDIDSILKKTDITTEFEIENKIHEVISDEKLSVKEDPDLETGLNIEDEFMYDYEIVINNLGTDLNMALVAEDKEENIANNQEELNMKITNEVGDSSKESNKKKKLVRKRKAKSEVRKKTKKELNRERSENEEAVKNKKFESDHAVKFLILSKEEQIEEIAQRKESRNYRESRFKCGECWKGFDAQSAYDNHMLRHNPNTGAFMCEVCLVRFRVRMRLNNHMELHRYKILCTECGFVSRTKAQAKDHHGLHAGKTFQCPHCGNSFQKRSSYLSHVRMLHPSLNVACDICGEMFVGDKGLKFHKARTHAEKLKCTTCFAKFFSVEALNRHTDTAGDHADLRPCEQCGENCASETELQQHVREEHLKETHRCEECSMEFSTASAYDTHHKRKHLNQRFRYEAGRGRGRGGGGRRPPGGARGGGPGRGQYVCEQCGHILPTEILLRYHQRNHQTVKPYACNHCPKTFALKQVRDIHVRSHTGEQPFKCPKCPRAFSCKTNLYRHNKTAHLNIHSHVPCPICAHEFSAKSYLRIHISTVHNGEPWPKRDRTKRKKKSQ